MEIPRVVHRVWLGGPEPEWMRKLGRTWDRPGWTLRQWGAHEIRLLFPLRNQELYERAEEIAPSHVGQLRSDILRYEILHRCGGVYVDTDFELLRPIDELLAGVECFFAWERPGRWINNAIIGATRRHPFLARLIDGLGANIARRRRGARPNKLSGPQYVTGVWRDHPDGVRVFPRGWFYPYLWDELERAAEEFPEAYCVHHWANRRRERGVPCPA